MYFYNLIKEMSEKEPLLIFVDMDGVIASYDVGKPLDFKNKRPLTENINKLKEIGKLPNIELHILSICKLDFQIKEKNEWLNKNAPFFKEENRIIISKEKTPNILSAELKANYLKTVKTNKRIVVIDDDNSVLKKIIEEVDGIIAFQDSELID